MTQAAIERGAAAVRRPDRWTRALIDVLVRIETAALPPRETCAACGCLCTPYERCPGCLAAVLRPTDSPARPGRETHTARRSA